MLSLLVLPVYTQMELLQLMNGRQCIHELLAEYFVCDRDVLALSA
jgi:hypothetical protein